MSIRVNVSDEVAQSESRDIAPVPTGKYLVQIDGCEIKESKSAANPGKPYAALEFAIQEPEEFAGRKIWTNIMLFGDKPFSAVWFGKAMGFYDGKGPLDFPEPGDLMGRQLVVKVIVVGETVDKNDSSKTYPPKNEVKGMWAEEEWNGASGAATSSATAAPAQRKNSILP